MESRIRLNKAMGTSRVHTFLTDRWYDLEVFDVAVDDEAGMGSCGDRVDVIFLAHERRPSGGEESGHRGRPKARLRFTSSPAGEPRTMGL